MCIRDSCSTSFVSEQWGPSISSIPSSPVSPYSLAVLPLSLIHISVTAEWTTPHAIDPFSIPVEQNIALLLNIDSELRAVTGVTLAETNLNFNREEQWFVSSEGSDIHQTKYSAGAGYTAYAFAGNEIQKRSFPNSYGGQWQNKGYELIEELQLVQNARRIAEEAVALHHADQCPEGKVCLLYTSRCV